MWIGPKQTPVLIICSALGIRPESLGYIINEVVSGGQTCRTSHPQAHGRLMFVSPECSLAFRDWLRSQLKQEKKRLWFVKSEESESAQTFFHGQPLFRKQKQAVWLTTRDNVKAGKPYAVAVPLFAECSQCCSLNHRRAQQRITGFQSVKSTATDRTRVYKTLIRPHIHCGANAGSVISSSLTC